ncbi:MAG: hypothetical protein JWQ47_2761 [Glaciihabitans sp.]|nr:hypothetical protein [Glaciihabitans sp.]
MTWHETSFIVRKNGVPTPNESHTPARQNITDPSHEGEDPRKRTHVRESLGFRPSALGLREVLGADPLLGIY